MISQLNAIAISRYAGNILLVIGYFVLLHASVKLGLILNLIGGFLAVPFAVQNKLWDLLVICGFFTVIEAAKLLSL